MSKREKRLEKIRQNPKNVRFDDLDRVLQDQGFERTQPRGGSSHYVYVHGEQVITVPYKRPFVKTVYVKEALKLLDENDE